jgi:hypothetical protein
MPMPAASKNMAPSNVPPMPNRRVNKEVKDDITPKAINGKVVSNPNIELESPVEALIWPTKGPTLASAGLRLNAINSMPAISKYLPDLDPLLFK